MSTILTTGGLGFIGSHTCISLIDAGYDVVIIDSLTNSSKNYFSRLLNLCNKFKTDKRGEIYLRIGDLRDKKLLQKIFEEFISKKSPILSVIHFAGLKSVEESIHKPIEYWDVNLNSTINLISVMSHFNCYSLIFSSSATIYKPTINSKITEEFIKEPINPYGNTKYCIEIFLEDIFKSQPKLWRICNLRYFNPVGAHASGLIGEDPTSKPTNLFPIILKVINGELDKLRIYGGDWPTKDGTCIRDFIHIMDLADAHLAGLEFINQNAPMNISINIGTGMGYSVLDVVENFKKLNNSYLPYEIVDRREGDFPYVIADNKLATKLLNWRPKRTIDQMCEDSLKWIRSN